MKRLALMDSSWLLMESRETPMHVAGLQLLTPPEGAGDELISNMLEWATNVSEVGTPFNRKILTRFGQTYWVEDKNFDIEYHVRHAALPKPGRIRELLGLVSRMHAQRMDINRPLWECNIIEGLEDGRIAVLTKMHHSMIDGVAGMRLMASRMSQTATAGDPPPWSAEWNTREKANKKVRKAGSATALPEVVREQVNVVTGLSRTARDFAHIYRKPESTHATLPYQAPKSIMNVRVTGARRFAADSWSLSRLKDVAKLYGGTLNDVVMTMCGGALRAYLNELGELPDKALTANVPVSLRTADQADNGGNAITVLQCSLATNVDGAVERLRVVQESMSRGKELLGRMSKAELQTYTTLVNLPFSVGQFLPIGGKVRPMYNVVISNVPGPRETLYLNGCELQANYPVSLVFHGYALNITITSYRDNLDFGLICAREVLPHMQRMLGHLEAELAELEHAAKPAKKKATPKKAA